MLTQDQKQALIKPLSELEATLYQIYGHISTTDKHFVELTAPYRAINRNIQSIKAIIKKQQTL